MTTKKREIKNEKAGRWLATLWFNIVQALGLGFGRPKAEKSTADDIARASLRSDSAAQRRWQERIDRQNEVRRESVERRRREAAEAEGIKIHPGTGQESTAVEIPADGTTHQLGYSPVGMAEIWEQYGGYIREQTALSGVEPAAVLAALFVESGGRFRDDEGHVIVRLELHKLRDELSRTDDIDVFNRFFQADNKTQPWLGHKYRTNVNGGWTVLHPADAADAQLRNKKALALAVDLFGPKAFRAASFGAPQVMGFNHDKLGYSTAAGMFEAFQASDKNQIDGFFAYCGARDCFPALRAMNWRDFARLYNGGGIADYAKHLSTAYHGDEEHNFVGAKTIVGEVA